MVNGYHGPGTMYLKGKEKARDSNHPSVSKCSVWEFGNKHEKISASTIHGICNNNVAKIW